MGKFYAVFEGRKPGVYNNWGDCQKQVNGCKNCIYKSFKSKTEAEYFVENGKCRTNEKTEKNLKSSSTQNVASNEFDTDTLLEIFGDDNDDFSDEDIGGSSKNDPGKSQKQCKIIMKNTTRKRTLLTQADASKRRKPNSTILISSVSSTSFETIKGMKFSADQSGRPVVFTDGACSNNGKKKAMVKAGYGVWWGEDHPLNLSRKLPGIQTNQRAEIAAVDAAIGQAAQLGMKELTIKTDSMFIINCITKWVQGWVRNGWWKADGKPVIHKTEFISILSGLERVKVNWVHVRGHQGIYGNEMADRLAVKGATL